MNNIFTEEQIKQIIEKAGQIAKGNNGVIPITKLEDAASLAAYIAGYSSWKQYRKSQKHEVIPNFETDYKVTDKNFSDQIINLSPEKILSFKEELLRFPKKNERVELKENKQLVFKINVGHKKNLITKSIDNIYLNIQNSCFIGSENNQFIENAKISLLEQQQCVIEINSKNSETKLNPISDLFETDILEDYLAQQSHDHKDFIFIWGLLIKQLLQQYRIKLTAKFLLQSLNLDFMLKLWMMLSQESNFLANMLINYIKSLPGIKMHGMNVQVLKESFERHWESIKTVYGQLTILDNAYDLGIFSYEGLSLLDIMLDKKSVDISIPTKKDIFIYQLLEFLFVKVSQEYSKQVDGLEVKEYAVFIINKHETLNKVFSNSDFVFSLIGIQSYKSNILIHFDQIVFTVHKTLLEPQIEFIRKFYLNTPKLDFNIFAESGKELVELDKNEAFIWQLENKEASYGSFIMQKINA